MTDRWAARRYIRSHLRRPAENRLTPPGRYCTPHSAYHEQDQDSVHQKGRREEQDFQASTSGARPKTWPVVLASAVRRDSAVVRARGLQEARNFTPGLSALIGGAR